MTSGLVNLGDGWLSSLSKLRSWSSSPEASQRGAEGEVEVAHVDEQAVDPVGGVGVVGRRQGAGDTEAVFKENLRGLRHSGRSRWLYRWFWLVWLG